MNRFRYLITGLMIAAAAPALPASAGLADPAYSHVDPVLIVCPDGDAVFRVEARDFANNPRSGTKFVIDFASCPTFPVCPNLPGSPYTIDLANQEILQRSDGVGVAEIPIRMGGVCPNSLVSVIADGVYLAQRSVVSPDQNGDLVVDALDLALLEAKLGQADPTGDFDGDGVVTAADVAALEAHVGHACQVATRVAPSTWGRLKLLYR